MAHANDKQTGKEREDLPGPAEDPDTGMIGSTDKRSSENRHEGLEDREKRQDGAEKAD